MPPWFLFRIKGTVETCLGARRRSQTLAEERPEQNRDEKCQNRESIHDWKRALRIGVQQASSPPGAIRRQSESIWLTKHRKSRTPASPLVTTMSICRGKPLWNRSGTLTSFRAKRTRSSDCGGTRSTICICGS